MKIKDLVKIGAITSLIGVASYVLVKERLAYLKELENESKNNNANHKLDMIVGVGENGKVIKANLKKMKNLILSGVTGSGKSIGLNNLVVSLLKQNTPNELKFLIVDTKRVEFDVFKSSPHLYAPVVTDSNKANEWFEQLNKEIERRYELLTLHHLKDIDEYHKLSNDNPLLEKMPRIVVVIDEFANIIYEHRDVDRIISRIAQIGYPVGVHLIISTQTPRREVITGLMKANIPSRLTFMLATSTESQIVIDEPSAEKLLPRGHFILRQNDWEKEYGQAPFISNEELNEIIKQDVLKYDDGKEVNESSFVDNTSIIKKQRSKANAELNELKDLIDGYFKRQQLDATLIEKHVYHRFGYFKYALSEDTSVIKDIKKLEEELKTVLNTNYCHILLNDNDFEIVIGLKSSYQVAINTKALFEK